MPLGVRVTVDGQDYLGFLGLGRERPDGPQQIILRFVGPEDAQAACGLMDGIAEGRFALIVAPEPPFEPVAKA